MHRCIQSINRENAGKAGLAPGEEYILPLTIEEFEQVLTKVRGSHTVTPPPCDHHYHHHRPMQRSAPGTVTPSTKKQQKPIYI
jgi:hypothetical protein